MLDSDGDPEAASHNCHNSSTSHDHQARHSPLPSTMSPVNPNRKSKGRFKTPGPSEHITFKTSSTLRKLERWKNEGCIVNGWVNEETGSYILTEDTFFYKPPASPSPNEPISSGYSPTSPPYSGPPSPEPLSPGPSDNDSEVNYTSGDEKGLIEEQEDKVAKGEIPPKPTWGFTTDHWNDLMTDYLRRKCERRRCLAKKYFQRWKYNSDLKRQTINLDILYNIQ